MRSMLILAVLSAQHISAVPLGGLLKRSNPTALPQVVSASSFLQPARLSKGDGLNDLPASSEISLPAQSQDPAQDSGNVEQNQSSLLQSGDLSALISENRDAWFWFDVQVFGVGLLFILVAPFFLLHDLRSCGQCVGKIIFVYLVLMFTLMKLMSTQPELLDIERCENIGTDTMCRQLGGRKGIFYDFMN